MSKSAPPKHPGDHPAKTAQQSAGDRKSGRLAAALRDNLKRRKAQQRARDEPGPDAPADGSDPGGAA